MASSSIQKRCAATALFLMPFSSLNFGISITIGDVFLVIAAVLNFRRLASLPGPQIWFLLTAPLFILSAATDIDSTWTSIAQVFYVFAFLLPFGWCAFADLTSRAMAKILVLSGICTALMAAGQFAGVVPALPTQQLVEYFDGRLVRVSGLGNAVNELTQFLAPLIAILPLVRPKGLRTPALLVILAGVAAAMSKQAVFGVLGLAWYLAKAGWRQWLVGAFVVLGCVIGFALFLPETTDRVVGQFAETAEYRKSYSDDALSERFDLVGAAVRSLPDCMFLGFGPRGSYEEMWRNGQPFYVHVYLIGLAMLGGVPAALLMCVGWLNLLWRLRQKADGEWSIFLVVALLGLQCHPAVLMSWQTLPILIAGALVAQGEAKTVHRSQWSKRMSASPTIRSSTRRTPGTSPALIRKSSIL